MEHSQNWALPLVMQVISGLCIMLRLGMDGDWGILDGCELVLDMIGGRADLQGVYAGDIQNLLRLSIQKCELFLKSTNLNKVVYSQGKLPVLHR